MLAQQTLRKKRGVRDVVHGIVAAALVMSPSYVGNIALHRLKLEISVVALVSLALFLVGVFLLLKLVED
jgi:hypothetical protein